MKRELLVCVGGPKHGTLCEHTGSEVTLPAFDVAPVDRPKRYRLTSIYSGAELVYFYRWQDTKMREVLPLLLTALAESSRLKAAMCIVQAAVGTLEDVPCRHDTDGDGNCHLCAGFGGCRMFGGPHPKRDE